MQLYERAQTTCVEELRRRLKRVSLKVSEEDLNIYGKGHRVNEGTEKMVFMAFEYKQYTVDRN